MTTTVEPLAVSLTATSVRGTVPQLLTIPLKVIGWPGQTGEGPQILVTLMQGAVQTVQLALTGGRGPVLV